jgi:hypothetical protein
LAAIGAIVPPWEHLVAVDIRGLPEIIAIVAAILLLRVIYIVLRPDARTVHTLFETAGGIIAYTAIMAPVSYLCARNSMPLFDDVLRAADAVFDFDWQTWAEFEHVNPAVVTVLGLAYASLLPQTVLVLTILPLVGDGSRGFSLLRASLIAVLIACAGSYALPAAGPDAIHTDWYPHWAALRTTGPFTMSLQQAQGIIAFPSFHASLAVLLLYFVRGLGIVTWATGALELLMLVSTPTFGHHYLCDVIAGVIVAIVALLITKQLDRLVPVTQRTERSSCILTRRMG